jgi:hypothetical protein
MIIDRDGDTSSQSLKKSARQVATPALYAAAEGRTDNSHWNVALVTILHDTLKFGRQAVGAESRREVSRGQRCVATQFEGAGTTVARRAKHGGARAT